MEHVISRTLPPLLVAIAALSGTGLAQAQVLIDPTRPPAAWLAALDPNAAQAAPDTIPDVQIVVVGPSRRFAVVNGEALYQGESHNGSTLVAIEPNGLVWRKGASQARTTMNPAARKLGPATNESLPADPKVRKKILNGGVK